MASTLTAARRVEEMNRPLPGYSTFLCISGSWCPPWPLVRFLQVCPEAPDFLQICSIKSVQHLLQIVEEAGWGEQAGGLRLSAAEMAEWFRLHAVQTGRVEQVVAETGEMGNSYKSCDVVKPQPLFS